MQPPRFCQNATCLSDLSRSIARRGDRNLIPPIVLDWLPASLLESSCWSLTRWRRKAEIPTRALVSNGTHASTALQILHEILYNLLQKLCTPPGAALAVLLTRVTRPPRKSTARASVSRFSPLSLSIFLLISLVSLPLSISPSSHRLIRSLLIQTLSSQYLKHIRIFEGDDAVLPHNLSSAFELDRRTSSKSRQCHVLPARSEYVPRAIRSRGCCQSRWSPFHQFRFKSLSSS